MFKALRVPEKLFALAMWVVSLVFAGFLIALGGKIVGELPGVDQRIDIESFVPASAITEWRAAQLALSTEQTSLNERSETANARLTAAQNETRAARENFDTWIAARTATTDPQQDPEVLRRQRTVESLKTSESEVQRDVDAINTRRVQLQQRNDSLYTARADLDNVARPAYERALFVNELTVFGLRLLITFPLLVLAAWLALKKRKSEYWPLARGFVLFAIFVFFVELAPYLPSYGGYVRYGVGVIGTFIAGVFVIRAMRRYLAKRQEVEQQSAVERKRTLDFEESIKKMVAGVCPGCERAIPGGAQTASNYCVHCGLHLFDQCGACNTRKNAFYQYCPTCGVPTDAKEINATNSEHLHTA